MLEWYIPKPHISSLNEKIPKPHISSSFKKSLAHTEPYTIHSCKSTWKAGIPERFPEQWEGQDFTLATQHCNVMWYLVKIQGGVYLWRFGVEYQDCYNESAVCMIMQSGFWYTILTSPHVLCWTKTIIKRWSLPQSFLKAQVLYIHIHASNSLQIVCQNCKEKKDD